VAVSPHHCVALVLATPDRLVRQWLASQAYNPVLTDRIVMDEWPLSLPYVLRSVLPS